MKNEIDKVPKTVNVLGTEYKIKFSSKENDPKIEGADGYFEEVSKEIYLSTSMFKNDDPLVIRGLQTKYWKKVLRHELIHAFICESGLDSESTWARNEEMVDWIARQFPKMADCFKEAGILQKGGF